MIDDLSISIPLAIICVLVSGFCSGTEVALFSLRRVDRDQLAKSTSATDRMIVKMLGRPRRLIATVLIGNETCTAMLAILALGFACRTCTTQLAAFAIALAITLPLVVLISEVTAKTLAAKAPLAWARACTGLLALFTFLITPARLVISTAAEFLLRPLGEAARTRPTRDLSEEEFRHLIDAGSAQGQVDARERRLIHRVFEFSDKNVGQVMTPRDRIFALSYDLPMHRLVREVAARGFSRVPIYQKSLDNVRGILNAKDLVKAAAGQPLGRPLAELLHEPLFVPRTTPVKRLFLTFKQKKVHIAIVVSEYGKVLGLVTMDDLLAQIFGVIRDERADLQAAIPKARGARTPAPGIPSTDQTGPILRETESGPIPAVAHEALDESHPVPREMIDEVSQPVVDPDAPLPSTVSPSSPHHLKGLGSPARKRPDTADEHPPDLDVGDPGVSRSGRRLFRTAELSADIAVAVLGPQASDEPQPVDRDPRDLEEELTPPAVDVDLIHRALGTTTDRQVAGLPSRTRTLPPAFHETPDDDDLDEAVKKGHSS